MKIVQIPCNPDTGCQNAEETAKSRVREALYKAIFETYTIKQWDKSPKDMDASVTARIPVRSDFDPRYFADTISSKFKVKIVVINLMMSLAASIKILNVITKMMMMMKIRVSELLFYQIAVKCVLTA